MYCKSRNDNKTKVKTVPYLFDLFTIRHFSLTSGRSESVGNVFVTTDAFLQTNVMFSLVI